MRGDQFKCFQGRKVEHKSKFAGYQENDWQVKSEVDTQVSELRKQLDIVNQKFHDAESDIYTKTHP